ncbi:MAG: serine hydrolase, partial [Actinobacteria bacterium]|nr:serine hydrolase [Actinomycetota bacterium]
MTTPISGHCDPRFQSVHDQFARNFAERGEVGAAVCVMVDGVIVVDLVGGWADGSGPDGGRRWLPDTMVNFYSVGKA